MSSKTRTLTLSSLFAAFTVIALYIASIWPTGTIGLAAAASIFVVAAIVESGIAPGISVYIVGSALGMLLLPNRSAPLLYMLFFGYYPVVKSFIERFKSKPLQWILKLCVFNLALTALWFLFGELIFDFGEFHPPPGLLYTGGSVLFVIFDYGFTKVIWLYINRVSKYLKGGRR